MLWVIRFIILYSKLGKKRKGKDRDRAETERGVGWGGSGAEGSESDLLMEWHDKRNERTRELKG